MEQGNDLQLQNASGPGVHVNVGVGTVCNHLHERLCHEKEIRAGVSTAKQSSIRLMNFALGLGEFSLTGGHCNFHFHQLLSL